MSIVMKGSEVAGALRESIAAGVQELAGQGVTPCLAIVRVGARPDDLAYERGAVKRMASVGIRCSVTELAEDIRQEEFLERFRAVNDDPAVHGILLFRPLPRQLDEQAVRMLVNPAKDVDGMCPVNSAKVFAGDSTGFAPCTPEAVMEVLAHYGVDLTGKRVTIVGRSMVVGRPLAMLMLQKHATVTICHTRTKDLPRPAGEPRYWWPLQGRRVWSPRTSLHRGATVIDVGINVDEQGNLCGDVDYDAVAPIAAAITPVPGGIGAVTSSVLAGHVLRAAQALHGEAGG